LESNKQGYLLRSCGNLMNTFEFFNHHFGKHLVSQEGVPHISAYRALSSSHKLVKGTESRLASGWAIIRPSISSIQLKLAATGLHFDERTRIEAFMEEFEKWDGVEPRIFLMFDKAPVPIENLFMTVDTRAIRICSPAGVETFDMNQAPTDESGGIQKAIWKRKA
jgi:hypothetical protein